MRWVSAIALLCCSASAAGAGDGAVRGFAAAGKTVWAVGDNALLLRSDDGGKAWQAVKCKLRADFTGAHFADEKSGCLFGGSAAAGHPGWASRAVIAQTTDGGKSFKPVGPPGAAWLHGGRMQGARGVIFGRASLGAASGAWVTVSAGRLWVPLETASAGDLLGGAFRDINLAYLVGPANRIVSVRRLAEPPIRPKVISSPAALRAAAYLAEESCWAVGEDGTVLRSVPGQRVWTSASLPLPAGARRLADLEAIAPAGKREAFLAGGLAARIFHTRDGGAKFASLPAPGPGPVHALTRLPGGTLLAGGDGGRIWISTDSAGSWKLARGREKVDVLFIAAPGDVSVFPALAAHALAGAETAMVFAAMPQLPPVSAGEPASGGEVFLHSAAAAAGAGGAMVLSDFVSVAGDPAAGQLDEEGVLKRWSSRLDVPARSEMLLHLAAAIRLYRPLVVATGPGDYQGRGCAAENHLVARLAAKAVKLAADESSVPALAKLGLKAHRVKRVFTGMAGNDRHTPPWAKRPKRPRDNVVVEFVGWRYPRGAGTSLSMLALRAAWLLPWVGPSDRPAEITGYRCSQPMSRRRLFTAGLTDARLAYQSKPPVDEGLASGATLRAAVVLKHKLGVTVGPILRAAKANPADPLPADLLAHVFSRLLSTGELVTAAEAQRELLAAGGAHPLFRRFNVAAVAIRASSEWTAQLTILARARRPTPKQFKAAVRRLPHWREWVSDEPGLMLLGKANAACGDFEQARLAYRQLARHARGRDWREAAKVELAALGESAAAAAAAGRAMVVPLATEAPVIDARLEEKFWPKAAAAVLKGPAGAPPAVVKLAATPTELLLAVQIAAESPEGPARARPPAWALTVAVDADRDTWTQLLLRCDSSPRRSLALLTRLAAPAALRPALAPLQARRGVGGWTIELAVPKRLMGIAPDKPALVRLQAVVNFSGGAKPAVLYLAPQADPRLLPRRYALLALPAAPAKKP